MRPRLQSLKVRLSEKPRVSPVVPRSIRLRESSTAACSRVSGALGEAVVAPVPLK